MIGHGNHIEIVLDNDRSGEYKVLSDWLMLKLETGYKIDGLKEGEYLFPLNSITMDVLKIYNAANELKQTIYLNTIAPELNDSSVRGGILFLPDTVDGSGKITQLELAPYWRPDSSHPAYTGEVSLCCSLFASAYSLHDKIQSNRWIKSTDLVPFSPDRTVIYGIKNIGNKEFVFSGAYGIYWTNSSDTIEYDSPHGTIVRNNTGNAEHGYLADYTLTLPNITIGGLNKNDTTEVKLMYPPCGNQKFDVVNNSIDNEYRHNLGTLNKMGTTNNIIKLKRNIGTINPSSFLYDNLVAFIKHSKAKWCFCDDVIAVSVGGSSPEEAHNNLQPNIEIDASEYDVSTKPYGLIDSWSILGAEESSGVYYGIAGESRLRIKLKDLPPYISNNVVLTVGIKDGLNDFKVYPGQFGNVVEVILTKTGEYVFEVHCVRNTSTPSEFYPVGKINDSSGRYASPTAPSLWDTRFSFQSDTSAKYNIRYYEQYILIQNTNKERLNKVSLVNHITITANEDLKVSKYFQDGAVHSGFSFNKGETQPFGADVENIIITQSHIDNVSDLLVGDGFDNTKWVIIVLRTPYYADDMTNSIIDIQLSHKMVKDGEFECGSERIFLNANNTFCNVGQTNITTLTKSGKLYPYYKLAIKEKGLYVNPHFQFVTGENNTVFLYDFSGIDYESKITNKINPNERIGGVNSSDIVRVDKIYYNNNKFFLNKDYHTLTYNSAFWDYFNMTNTFTIQSASITNNNMYKVYQYITLYRDTTLNFASPSFVSLYSNSVDNHIDLWIGNDNMLTIGANTYNIKTTEGVFVIGFGMYFDHAEYSDMNNPFPFRRCITILDTDNVLQTIILPEELNEYTEPYSNCSIITDNVYVKEIRGIDFNIISSDMLDVGQPTYFSGLFTTYNQNILTSLYNRLGYSAPDNYTLPILTPYNIPIKNPLDDFYVDYSIDVSNINETFMFNDIVESPIQRPMYDVSDIDSVMGYCHIPIKYGMYQKVFAKNSYKALLRTASRFSETKVLDLGFKYLGGTNDLDLHPYKIDYLNYRHMETKEYDFKVYIADGIISKNAYIADIYDNGITYPINNTVIDQSLLSPDGDFYQIVIDVSDENLIYGEDNKYLFDGSKLAIYGDEIVEIEQYDFHTELNTEDVEKYTLISYQIISINRKFMIPQHHNNYEMLRTVQDISNLISSYQIEDKLINKESNIFTPTTSNSTFEIKDDVNNWSKFNPSRLYKANKGAAVYFFEGNKEDLILRHLSFIESVNVEMSDETTTINTISKISQLHENKINSVETVRNDTVESVVKKIFSAAGYDRPIMYSYSGRELVNEFSLPAITVYNIGEKDTFGQALQEISNIGIRVWVDTKERIVLDFSALIRDTSKAKVMKVNDLEHVIDNSFKLAINENGIYNGVDIEFYRRFPMYNPDDFEDIYGGLATMTNTNKNLVFYDHNYGTFMNDGNKMYSFNLLEKPLSFSDFNNLRTNFGNLAVIAYTDALTDENIQLNCKLADSVIDPSEPNSMKLSIAPGFDYCYQDYLYGFKQYLFTNTNLGDQIEAPDLRIYVNPNTLPILYQWATESDSGVKDTSHRYALLPGEQKVLLAKLSEPSNIEFEYAGFIDRMEDYCKTWTGVDLNGYNIEMVNTDTTPNSDLNPFVRSTQPFLVNSSIVETVGNQILQKDFSNDYIDVTIEPKDPDALDKEDYDFKITISNNIDSENKPIATIQPLQIIQPSIIKVSEDIYNTVKLGYIIKPSASYEEDTSNPQYSNYIKYKDTTYSIISKSIDGINNYYLQVDKFFPADRDYQNKYLMIDIYANNDVVLLNHFHIRGNPILQTVEKYSATNLDSVNYFGEKIYNISVSMLDIGYVQEFVDYILNYCSGGYYNESTGEFQESIKNSLPLISFKIHKEFGLYIGSLCKIDVMYYNINYSSAIFQIVGIKRTFGEPDEYQAILYHSNLTDFINYPLEYNKVSQYKPISSTDPTIYLTADQLRVPKLENVPALDVTPNNANLTKVENGLFYISCSNIDIISTEQIYSVVVQGQVIRGRLLPESTTTQIIFCPTIDTYTSPPVPSPVTIYINPANSAPDTPPTSDSLPDKIYNIRGNIVPNTLTTTELEYPPLALIAKYEGDFDYVVADLYKYDSTLPITEQTALLASNLITTDKSITIGNFALSFDVKLPPITSNPVLLKITPNEGKPHYILYTSPIKIY